MDNAPGNWLSDGISGARSRNPAPKNADSGLENGDPHA
jgi:hypothetical protein